MKRSLGRNCWMWKRSPSFNDGVEGELEWWWKERKPWCTSSDAPGARSENRIQKEYTLWVQWAHARAHTLRTIMQWIQSHTAPYWVWHITPVCPWFWGKGSRLSQFSFVHQFLNLQNLLGEEGHCQWKKPDHHGKILVYDHIVMMVMQYHDDDKMMIQCYDDDKMMIQCHDDDKMMIQFYDDDKMGEYSAKIWPVGHFQFSTLAANPIQTLAPFFSLFLWKLWWCYGENMMMVMTSVIMMPASFYQL